MPRPTAVPFPTGIPHPASGDDAPVKVRPCLYGDSPATFGCPDFTSTGFTGRTGIAEGRFDPEVVVAANAIAPIRHHSHRVLRPAIE